jgi:hypothetical protein
MDVYEENHICNHTDAEGRYSYKVRLILVYPGSQFKSRSRQYQPTMMLGHFSSGYHHY